MSNDLFGRKLGSLPDQKYSEELIAFGQDKVWDEATLTTFLHDPQRVVEGTKMAFFGLQRRTRRSKPCSPMWRRSTEWPQNRIQPKFKLRHYRDEVALAHLTATAEGLTRNVCPSAFSTRCSADTRGTCNCQDLA